ncbi:Peroxiredoxin [Novosphingobium nitrogenifigens DSM 19370]|uniref:Thioredoxin peroxidase n=1 Tax=Novosphingobium nitrogenifigens DSM 19370 TaxID=983920 RepID=F1Z605_9SPHN|nr:peroxiredoxin [Novosphingobium nitrogenifigens]EGD59969.1 Peroxiredoxin [Novosphingobium nitrogenifigens DSM 19370]
MDNPDMATAPTSAWTPLRIGDPVPDFTARSTHGMVRLSDYRGRWLLFFSHPADFTPVCTSEFIAFARAADQFEELGCSLLGHSVDSLFSHLAWLRAIRDDLGVTIPFPIVEDPTLEIARAFGMAGYGENHSSSVRAVCFIDPEGTLVASTVYPITVGRSVAEMLRTVAALQRTASEPVMTPEGWQPGDPVLLPPDFTADEVLASDRSTSWFFRTGPAE